jgi:hypothetical protein
MRGLPYFKASCFIISVPTESLRSLPALTKINIGVLKMANKIINQITKLRLGRMIFFKRRGRRLLLFEDAVAYPIQQISICTG